MKRLSRTVTMLIVTPIVLALFGLMHTSVGLFLSQLLPSLEVAAILSALSIISVVSLFLNHWIHNWMTVVLYWVGMVWMGSVFIAFLVFFPAHLIQLYTPIHLPPSVPISVCIGLILYSIYCAFFPTVVHISLPVKGLKKRVRIVQVTDIHTGTIYGPRFVRSVVRIVNRQNPDLVVVTGDLFDGNKFYAGMITPLHELQAKTYFISGNHELYAGMREALSIVRETPLEIIEDRVVTTHGIQLAGVHYHAEHGQTTAVVRQLGKRLKKDVPSVLLRHEPADIGAAEAAGFSMQLSGHTHNGQVWPLSYLVRLAYRYRVGLHRHGNLWLYISPGTGSWGPPLRLGSRSEITVIDLH